MIDLLRRIIIVAAHEGVGGFVRRLQYRVRLGRVVYSVYGIRLRANFGDETFNYCWFGLYGSFFEERLRSRTKQFVFLDIGANQGLYTILAAKNTAASRVYSFEPVKKTAALLRENLILNGVEEKCKVYQVAISSRSGVSRINIWPNHSGAAALERGNVRQEERTVSEKIRTVTRVEIDSLIPVPECDIIVKVDVEGHEPKVISELVEAAFFARVTEIFFEVDENWFDPEEVINTLRSEGFVSFKRIGAGHHYDILATRF